MDFAEILILVIGLMSPWFLWRSIKVAVSEVLRIRRCTAKTTAQILSWRIEEDSDNPTTYTPTIRYTFHNRDYEAEFWEATVTRYQKERDYTEDTMTIWVDPDDPANITPENKRRTLCRLIEDWIAVCGIALCFFLLGILFIIHRIG